MDALGKDPRPAIRAIATLLAVALAGCGGAKEGADGGAAATATPATKAGTERPTKVAIGEEATLTGLHGDMRVRVTKVVDPLPDPETERPKAGRRFVGVQVTLTNVGKQAYRDAPLNGSALVTDLPKAANPTILIGGRCTSKLGTKLRMPAGTRKRLCLPFQVKKQAKISAFRFRLNSGFGPETGEWAVK